MNVLKKKTDFGYSSGITTLTQKRNSSQILKWPEPTGMANVYLMIKVDYTAQKKLLPDLNKFKLNQRGVSFLRECIITCFCIVTKILVWTSWCELTCYSLYWMNCFSCTTETSASFVVISSTRSHVSTIHLPSQLWSSHSQTVEYYASVIILYFMRGDSPNAVSKLKS